MSTPAAHPRVPHGHTDFRRLRLQGFLAAYLSVADCYLFRSGAELGKGHADIAPAPLSAPASV